MTSALTKILLILTDMFCMHATATPPNPPQDPAHCVVFLPDWKERFLRSLAWPCVLLRTISYTSSVLQILLIVAPRDHARTLSWLLIEQAAFPACTTRLSRISPIAALGISITILGTLLRVQCYRTLGRYFTFTLSLQDEHTLVTSGPYALVRHPSYTALILTLIGGWMTFALEGSFACECGAWDLPVGRAIMGLWAVVATAVAISLMLRLPSEDDMLARRFGKEWETWREAVPWRLVPWVF